MEEKNKIKMEINSLEAELQDVHYKGLHWRAAKLHNMIARLVDRLSKINNRSE